MTKQSVEFTFRSTIILWSAFLFSQSTFIFILYMTRPELFHIDFSQPILGDKFVIIVSFGFIAIVNIFVSLFLRYQAVDRAIDEKEPKILQQGQVISCAFCESVSLLGLVLALVFNYQYFIFWFILATIGLMLNFPRRQNFFDASSEK